MDVMSLDGAYACSIVHGIRVRYTQGRVEKALEFPYDTQRGVFWAREGWICEAWIVVPLENRQDWDTRRMGLEEGDGREALHGLDRTSGRPWMGLVRWLCYVYMAVVFE
jgi:hypothetical protein